MALRTVGVRLTAEIGPYQAKLKQASQSTRDFKGELEKAAKGGHLEAVTRQAAIAGLGLTGMAAYAVKANADFDKAMSGVAASANASAAEIGQLRAAALQAGKDTQYSATEAAQGITELSKAGVKTADVLGGGLKGALALAAAGQLSVGEAAETAASALTQFKLKGSDVPHVADLLAAGAGKAQGSVHDMGAALNQSGLIASQFGLSIEDTIGVLAEFANAGLIGSDAGTSFKTMLGALANPSKQSRDQMNELGISFYDASGKFVGLSGVAQILQTRLKGVTDETRQQTLGQIFGNDAIRAASILYTDGAAGVAKWKNGVNEAGYSTETAAKLTDNLAGDIERLKGSIETLAIESGSGANGGLRVLVKALDAFTGQISSLPSGVGSVVTVLGALGGAALLTGAGWVKMRRSTADMLTELRNVGPGGEKAAVGLEKTTKWAGRAALAFGAVQVAAVAIDAAVGKDLNPQVDALSLGLQRFAASGDVSGETARLLGGDMGKLDTAMKDVADTGRWSSFARGFGGSIESFTGTSHAFDDSLTQSKERLSAVDQALQQLVTGGHADQAAQIFSSLADRAKEQGVSAKELKAVLPGYSGAIETAGAASKAAAGKVGDLNSALDQGAKAQDKYKTHADAVAGAAKRERGALGALFSELKAQTDPVFALIEAQRKLRDAQDVAAKAVKQHGAKSKEAKDADLALAQAAIDLQGATGNLSGTFNGKLTPSMRDTLRAAGLTEKQIKTVEGQFKTAKTAADKFAGKYAAEASAPGAKQAKKDLDLAYTAANGFAGPYVAHISVDGDKPVNAKLEALLIKQRQLATGLSYSGARGAVQKDMDRNRQGAYDTGGWTGPGDTHDVAGVVHADEFVVRKSARGQLEAQKPGALDYMNQTGRWPGYASGGQVWPFDVNVSKTKIPDPMLLGGAGPGGGATDDWIIRAVMARFPALHYISKFRKGAMTLTGNRSYHSMHRAVDWPANYELALWWHNTYGGRTKELITPWNELNIHNGQPHRYTGAVWNQHNFAGGNAHDHIAMANGGVIREPVAGVGRSGRTYSFGENGPETVIPGYAGGGLVNVAPGAAVSTPTRGSRLDTANAMLSAASAVAQLSAALKENGRSWSVATQKGRDNRSALISGIRAAQDAAKAKFDETGSVKAANRVYDDYVHQLDASLRKMKVNAATRKALIRAYSERPKYDLPDAPTRAPSNSSGRVGMVTDQIGVEQALANAQGAFSWTTPTFNVKSATGQAELQQLFSFLSAAQAAAQSSFDYNGNAAGATSYYNGYLNQLRAVLRKSGLSNARIDDLFRAYGRITLTPKANRWGGLYEHAAGGALKDAQIAAGGPTRYAWAEAETGGELFAPKHGNLQKTRQQVGWAVANWWGGNVNWGGQGGAKHMTIEATIPITLGAEVITQQVRMEIDTQLGQVATAVIHQSA